MNCKNVQSQLSAYLDEELTGREMLEVRGHLSECSGCAEELRSIQVVKRMLGGTPVPEPSADFENRLVSRVLSATVAPAEQRKLSILAFTGIAAASMLATLLALNSMHRESPTVVDKGDTLPFELIQRDRAFAASADPMGGSPVVFRRH